MRSQITMIIIIIIIIAMSINNRHYECITGAIRLICVHTMVWIITIFKTGFSL